MLIARLMLLSVGVLVNADLLPSGFDVTSVKPVTGCYPSGIKTEPGRLMARCASLGELIELAYNLPQLRISGVPTNLGRFDIEGKTEGTHTRAELLEMLKTLLADRFKLTIHREEKELPVMAFVAGSPQAALKPAADATLDPNMGIGPGSSNRPGAISIHGQNVTMELVATYLSNRLQNIVVDRTGKQESFDFNVEVFVDPNEARDPSVPEREWVNHMYIGFLPKIGLKTQVQKAVVGIIVVDHAEKPDEN